MQSPGIDMKEWIKLVLRDQLHDLGRSLKLQALQVVDPTSKRAVLADKAAEQFRAADSIVRENRILEEELDLRARDLTMLRAHLSLQAIALEDCRCQRPRYWLDARGAEPPFSSQPLQTRHHVEVSIVDKVHIKKEPNENDPKSQPWQIQEVPDSQHTQSQSEIQEVPTGKHGVPATTTRSSPVDVGGFEVFVGNLKFRISSDDLEELFSRAGRIFFSPSSLNARIVKNRDLSLGYGFVRFATMDGARRAVKLLDGEIFQDRVLNVQHANAHADRSRGSKGSTARNHNAAAVDRASPDVFRTSSSAKRAKRGRRSRDDSSTNSGMRPNQRGQTDGERIAKTRRRR
ncbi:hypothetical protein DFJ73DRAFT_961379 [Zopfochytrium polystomum]|nr:hypothetical protein DFJ73DRAFT_961379 [Zopfochytrium polystomum]